MPRPLLTSDGSGAREDEHARPEGPPHAFDLADHLKRAMGPHFEALWRFARRLGVREGDVDDVLQEVVLVLAGRIGDVPEDKEKAFLFSTTFRIASEHRRKGRYREEVASSDAPEPEGHVRAQDDALDDTRARAELQRILDGMPLGQRAVFILYEIEEHTMIEIASLLELPPGTVASRLRSAREHFEGEVARVHARDARQARGMR